MRVARDLDSRRYERTSFHAGVVLETRPEAPRPTLRSRRDATPLPIRMHARCVEIGCGGLRCEAQQVLAPGTVVAISIDLETRGPFIAMGHVVWSRMTLRPVLLTTPRRRRSDPFEDDATMGIAFDGLPPDALLPIAALIESRRRAVLPARRIRPQVSFR